MAKKQDFASKTMKVAKHGKSCPVCGEIYSHAKVVNLVSSSDKNSHSFEEKLVAICKCNEKEVYA